MALHIQRTMTISGQDQHRFGDLCATLKSPQLYGGRQFRVALEKEQVALQVQKSKEATAAHEADKLKQLMALTRQAGRPNDLEYRKMFIRNQISIPRWSWCPMKISTPCKPCKPCLLCQRTTRTDIILKSNSMILMLWVVMGTYTTPGTSMATIPLLRYLSRPIS